MRFFYQEKLQSFSIRDFIHTHTYFFLLSSATKYNSLKVSVSVPSWYNLCIAGILKEIWQHKHLYKLIIYMKHHAWNRYWIQAKRKWFLAYSLSLIPLSISMNLRRNFHLKSNGQFSARLKSSNQKQRRHCLYHLSTMHSLKVTVPSSAT